MYEMKQSESFAKWLAKLRSRETRFIVGTRIRRMEEGNLGDVKSVGDGVYEARIHVAGGLRLYFMRQGSVIIVLLIGGDKTTQSRDIEKAKLMAQDWED
jgi:putative addiction module killer protein